MSPLPFVKRLKLLKFSDFRETLEASCQEHSPTTHDRVRGSAERASVKASKERKNNHNYEASSRGSPPGYKSRATE